MDLKTTLQEIGLDDKEIAVYLATLELGESTVLPISKKANLKRTYCYDILASLTNKKLVYFMEKNNRRRYVAEDPRKLEEILKNRLRNFESILPELKSIYNFSGNKPKVRFYEGKSGMIEVYETISRVKAFDAIASPEHLVEGLGSYFKAFSAKVLQKKVKIRELVTSDGENVDYIKKYKKSYQEARLLPEGIKLDTDTIIFENCLALISYSEELHAVVIESSSIVDSFKVYFELLWKQSKIIKKE